MPSLRTWVSCSDEPVRDRDRQRHQLGRVVAGVAEHQALVAGALLVERVDRLAGARLVAGVDALGDVAGLAADGDHDAAGVPVEALGRRVVADLEDPLAHLLLDVDVAAGGDLAGHDHQAGGEQGLDRDAAARVLLEHRVEHRVADLVSDLVRVTLGHGLGGEESSCHGAAAPFRRSIWSKTLENLTCRARSRLRGLEACDDVVPDHLRERRLGGPRDLVGAAVGVEDDRLVVGSRRRPCPR